MPIANDVWWDGGEAVFCEGRGGGVVSDPSCRGQGSGR